MGGAARCRAAGAGAGLRSLRRDRLCRGRMRPMRDRLIFTSQFIFTLIVAAFLVVPAILSISAGVTVNYFRGIQSGVTLQWVWQVWELYAGTILLSFVIAFATLFVALLA